MATLVLANQYLPLKYHVSLEIMGDKPNFVGEIIIPLKTNAQYKGSTEAFEMRLNSAHLIILEASIGDVKLLVDNDRENDLIVLKSDSTDDLDGSSLFDQIYGKY